MFLLAKLPRWWRARRNRCFRRLGNVTKDWYVNNLSKSQVYVSHRFWVICRNISRTIVELWISLYMKTPYWCMSALVNIRQKALLSSIGFRKRMTSWYTWLMYTFASIVHSDLSDDLKFVSRSCLAFSIVPRLIQQRRCHCIHLEIMFYCFASIKPLSARRRSFQWMLLSNIPSMAPDRMAFRMNYTNKQIIVKWTTAPSNNFSKYWRE